MAINITKVINQIQTRLDDSTQSDRDLTALIKAANRLDNSGASVLTYRSTGQLPAYTDSSFYGTIAYVQSDNVFGDSDGRFYYASSRDSNWIALTLTQDSDEATITAGGGGAAYTPQTTHQGTNDGYVMGGWNFPTPGNALVDPIDKFPFASDTNATQIMTLATATRGIQGGGSSTHGYGASGYTSSSINTIFSFPYANSDAMTTSPVTMPVAGNVGLLGNMVGPPDRSKFYAFVYGAGDRHIKISTASEGAVTSAISLNPYPAPTIQPSYNQFASGPTQAIAFNSSSPFIMTWPFASDNGWSSTGDAVNTVTAYSGACSSTTHGYKIRGPASNVIEKYAFAGGSNATDVGDLQSAANYGHGISSTNFGYSVGGGGINGFEKFPFASDANSTDVGDLSTPTTLIYHGSTQG